MMMILILWARQPDWKVLKEFLGLFEVLMMQKGCFSVCHIPALKEIYSRALNKGGTFQSSARLNSPIHLGGDEWPRWHCRVLYGSSKDFSSKWSGCSGRAMQQWMRFGYFPLRLKSAEFFSKERTELRLELPFGKLEFGHSSLQV